MTCRGEGEEGPADAGVDDAIAIAIAIGGVGLGSGVSGRVGRRALAVVGTVAPGSLTSARGSDSTTGALAAGSGKTWRVGSGQRVGSGGRGAIATGGGGAGVRCTTARAGGDSSTAARPNHHSPNPTTSAPLP